MPAHFDPPGGMDRFWRKVAIGASGECWPWLACVNKSNGVFAVKGGRKTILITCHREAWLRTRGAIPDGLKVLHTCETTTCCNPEHLYLATDAGEGKKENRRKLTWSDVCEMRRLSAEEHVTQRNLADLFKVSAGVVSRILRGIDWKTSNGPT
jgi:hypothetical protein